jgi:E3 ubiquitin-protein ligase ZSWIM2
MNEANESTFFLVQETGPTSFVLQNERDVKVRVRVGSTIHCSCGGGIKEHCVHTMFALIKIYRVPTDNPLSWQIGFNDSEINWLCKHRFSSYKAKPQALPQTGQTELKRIALSDEMCCAICQDDLTADQVLTYCREGCGHNFHARCMKVWADHKATTSDQVSCPLCRSNFSLDFLRDLKKQALEAKKKKKSSLLVHADTQCTLCKMTPITGERYHCVICQTLDCCGKCFRLGTHQHHPFLVRHKPSDSWVPVDPILAQSSLIQPDEQAQSALKPQRSTDTRQTLGEFLANALMLTDEGICVLCGLDQRQILRRLLRCGHTVHEACLVEVMQDSCNSCPVDGAQILPGLESLLATPVQPSLQPDTGFSVAGRQMTFSQSKPRKAAVLRIRTVHSKQSSAPTTASNLPHNFPSSFPSTPMIPCTGSHIPMRTANARSAINERRPPLKPTPRITKPVSQGSMIGPDLSVVGRTAGRAKSAGLHREPK